VFVPIAEETGLVLDIGHWAIGEACNALRNLHALGAAGAPGLSVQLRVGINISGHQFRSDAFIEQVRAALEQSAVPPDRVVLEITEGSVMGRNADTLRRLHALKALGVQLAIDDFGTGYSSLSYLQQFPLDVLKVDKSFVRDVTDGGSHAALARTILTLGELMRLRTLAEGVETQEQRLELLRMGCRFGQGFLFSRPILAADIAGWAARHVKQWREAPRAVARRITREFEIAAVQSPSRDA
jgi:EAL domain-containing protein (putative c-di-GMP-specific phosphodiesterase class I)